MSSPHSESLNRESSLQPPTEEPAIWEGRDNASSRSSSSYSPSQSPSPSPSRSPSKTVRFSDAPETSRTTDKLKRRQANLYDAIAGRVTTRGIIQDTPDASNYRNTALNARVRRPEEVLLRENHPMTLAENGEPYFAHENLPADRPLPDSDLLQSIHAYTADLYKHTLGESGRRSHYSMNESALLAVGILVEELAREELGEKDDLLMIEPQGRKGEVTANPAEYIVKRGRKAGWRTHIYGEKAQNRRTRSRSTGPAKRKRPRLEDLVTTRKTRANATNAEDG